MSPLWTQVAQLLSDTLQKTCTIEGTHSIGGGCINASYRVTAAGEEYFVKVNDASKVDMFRAEAAGLEQLATTSTLRVPYPIGVDSTASQAFIVMESLPLGGRGDMEEFGRQLAALHGATDRQYGWHRDNTIGSTHQPNTPHHNWIEFWRQHRLGYQLDLVQNRDGNSPLYRCGRELMERFPQLFDGYSPQPSLLHGDLWSGNYAFTSSGEAVIFDPAVYFGDREADIAMTELFGGFGDRFYAAYEEVLPLSDGYPIRKRLYNLYHILNHYNMFGGGYGAQAEGMVQQLLDECRA